MEGLLFWAAAGAIAYFAWKKGLKTPEQVQADEDEAEIDKANPPWREEKNLQYPKVQNKPTKAAPEGDQGKKDPMVDTPGFAGVEPESAEKMTRARADNPFKTREKTGELPRRSAGSFDDRPDAEIPDPEDADPSDVEDDTGVDGYEEEDSDLEGETEENEG